MTMNQLKTNYFNHLRGIGEVLLAIIILVYGVWKTSYGLENLMDIRFYDESYYLTQGIFHPIKSWLADYSPLYSLHYFLFSKFSGSEPIQLYYQNYRFWALILSFTVFSTLRLSGVNYWFSFIWALCCLSAEINYPLWPKAGHLAMFGVFLCLTVVFKLNFRPFESSLFCTGMCFLIAWCRPEFILGACTGLVISAYLFWKNKPKTFSFNYVWILIPFMIAGLCWLTWGLPVGNSGRGMVAIGQHYVHNWRNFSGNNKTDFIWEWINWREQFGKDFGTTENIFTAVINNPLAICKHLWFNLKLLPGRCFVYFFETLLPNRWLGLPLGTAIFALWLVVELLHKFNVSMNWFEKSKSRLLKIALILLIVSIPSLSAGLLFQPRPHYLIPLYPVFLMAIGSLVQEYSFPFLKKEVKSMIGITFLLGILFFLPNANAYFKIEKAKKSTSTNSNQLNYFQPLISSGLKCKTIANELMNMDWPKGTRIFDASTGYTDYLGQRVERLGKIGFEINYPILSDFGAFVKKENVNVIFLRKEFFYDRFFSKQKSWQNLKANWSELGWQKISVGQNGDSLFFKKPESQFTP